MNVLHAFLYLPNPYHVSSSYYSVLIVRRVKILCIFKSRPHSSCCFLSRSSKYYTQDAIGSRTPSAIVPSFNVMQSQFTVDFLSSIKLGNSIIEVCALLLFFIIIYLSFQRSIRVDIELVIT